MLSRGCGVGVSVAVGVMLGMAVLVIVGGTGFVGVCVFTISVVFVQLEKKKVAKRKKMPRKCFAFFVIFYPFFVHGLHGEHGEKLFLVATRSVATFPRVSNSERWDKNAKNG